jgi:hypothetical protein
MEEEQENWRDNVVNRRKMVGLRCLVSVPLLLSWRFFFFSNLSRKSMIYRVEKY